MKTIKLKRRTLLIQTGYNPENHGGAAKTPVILTSTFIFKGDNAAEQMESQFEILGKKRKPRRDEKLRDLYMRFSNENMRTAESKMTVLEDGAKGALILPSGMSAITTSILALLRPGQVIIYTQPVYGCTEIYFRTICKKYGIIAVPVDTSDARKVEKAIKKYRNKIAMIFIETPANPNMRLADIEALSDLARKYETKRKKIWVMVDNTFLSPIYQKPFLHGADLVVYSATKFIGGHSDLLGGFVLAKCKEHLRAIKEYRDTMGPIIGPFECCLIIRSLETLEIRMKEQTESAIIIAQFLALHPKVRNVYYPGLLKPGDPQYDIYVKQCLAPGSMISFDLKNGTKKMAFMVINGLKIFVIAVSLGARESLACHPLSTTHSAVPVHILKAAGVTTSLIRLSIGGEDPEDLINDLKRALKFA